MTYGLKTLIVVASITFLVGLVIGLVIGLSRNKRLADSLKPIQIVGILLFIGYILVVEDVDSVVALGILALIPGELIGRKVGEVIEKGVSK